MNILLFTDLVGSTKLSRENAEKAEAIQEALFDGTQTTCRSNQGKILQYSGDGFLCGFDNPLKALAAAVDMITAVKSQGDHQLRVALHFNNDLDPQPIGRNYDFDDVKFDDIRTWANVNLKFGHQYSVVAFTARLLSSTNSDQILVSQLFRNQLGNELRWKAHDPILLKDWEDQPETTHEYLYDGATRGQPGRRYLPKWYDGEVNPYVHREFYDREFRTYFKEKQAGTRAENILVLFADGGTGKTRLAYETVARVSGFYTRSFFIKLANFGPIKEGSFMDDTRTLTEGERQNMLEGFVQAITTGLGVEDEYDCLRKNGIDVAPALTASLKLGFEYPKPVILVLDNWESIHSPETQSLLCQLASELHNWQFVLTTRIRIATQAQHVTHDLNDGLTESESVELFTSRWHSYAGVRPGKTLELDPILVSEIVQECAYWPLAIELAATAKHNVPNITLEEVLQGLRDEPLTSYDAGDVTMTMTEVDKRRHQSLQRSLQYSFNLLSSELQVAAVQCGLFEQDWTKGAMRAAINDDRLGRTAGKLQNASRINWIEEQTHFSVHRVARAFYRQKFEDAAFAEVVSEGRARLDAYYSQLLGAVTPQLGTSGGTAPRETLDHEGPLNWSEMFLRAEPDTAPDERTCANWITRIGFFWSYLSTGQAALARLEEAGGGLISAAVLQSRGDLYHRQGNNDDALAAWESAEKLYVLSGDPQGQANVLQSRGGLYYRQGNNDDALAAWESAEKLYVLSGSPQGQANVLQSRGGLYYMLGNNDDALAAWESAEKLYVLSGDPLGQANVLQSRGDLYYMQGNNDDALAAWESAEKLYVLSGDPQGQANVLQSRGDLYYRQGNNDDALAAWESAEKLYVLSGSPLGQANVLKSRGDLYYRQGNNDDALAAWESAEKLYVLSGDPQGQANVLKSRGGLYYMLGNNNDALAAWESAEKLYVLSGDPLGQANVLQSRGDLYYRQGNNDDALAAWESAEKLYVLSGDPQGQANVLQSRGGLYYMQGNNDDALAAWESAEKLYVLSGSPLGQANVLKSRGGLYYMLGNNDDALAAWESAEKLYVLSGDPQGQANVLQSRGGLYYMQGNNDDALSAWESAEKLYVLSGSPLGQANVLKSRGDLYYRQGNNDDALAAWESAEKLYVLSGSPQGQANVLQSRGDLYYRQGNNDDALAAWESAEKLYVLSGSPQGQANVLQSRGGLYYRQGNNDDALAAWESAEKLYVLSGDPLGQANVLQSRGDLYYMQGNNDDALAAWESAEKLYVLSGDPQGQANVLKSRGGLYHRQGNNDDALAAWESAEKLYVLSGDPQGQANVLQSRGGLYYMQGNNDDALSAWESAEKLYVLSGSPLGIANLQYRRAVLYQSQGSPAEAQMQIASALNTLRELGMNDYADQMEAHFRSLG